MSTKEASENSNFKPISEEVGKITEELGITPYPADEPQPVKPVEKEVSTPKDDLKEFLKLVNDCSVKILHLFGVMTPKDTIKAIAEELMSINPHILLNCEVILKSIGFINMQFRNPKQLILDDFIIGPEKQAALREKGVLVYTHDKVAEILKEYSPIAFDLLKGKIDNLERELEMEKIKNKYLPLIQGEKAIDYLNDRIEALIQQNMTLSDELDAKDRHIRLLERRIERLNYMKNGQELLVTLSQEETKEAVPV
jgi:hypothetical protein